jgi:hypothetical protein
MKNLRYPLVALLILLWSLVLACATDQGATKEKKPKQKLTREEKSRQEWDERVLQNSWYGGSDYYHHQQSGGGINVGEWLQTRRELKAKQEETDQRLAKLEEKVQVQQTTETQEQAGGTRSAVAGPAPAADVPQESQPEQGFRFKVAMIFLPEVYGSASDKKEELFEAATGQFASHPWFLLVDPEETEGILVQQELAVSERNMAQIGRTLGVYPAARLVVFVDRLALEPRSNIVEGRLGYTLVDGFSGRTITQGEEIASIESGASGSEELLRVLMARTALDLEKRAVKYGWSSRVAMVEGNRVFLSAGKASGLKPGDIFAVYGPGREIIHPIAKVSMGFQQGPYRGKVKVLNLFGGDAAEATVVSGSGKIEVNDVVVLPEKGN